MLDSSQRQFSSLSGQCPVYNALKCHHMGLGVLFEVLEKS